MSFTNRTFLLSYVLLWACGAPTPGPVYSGAMHSSDALRDDVSTVLTTLEEAYGPKALIVPVAWQRLRRQLEALEVDPMSNERFCDVLGSVLTEFRDPGLFVTLEPGANERCHAEDVSGHSAGMPSGGVASADNFATGDALYEVRRQGQTTLIGVRHFAPRDDPGWEGMPVFDVNAPAILLDLRGAGGTDPRALLDRIWGMTEGRRVGFPLRNVVRAEGSLADAARGRAEALGSGSRRDSAVWSELVGPPRPSYTPQRKPAVAVLIDSGCEEACQLVARVLETWGDATIVGTLSTANSVLRDDPGVVLLPQTGIALHFQTTAYVLNWAIDFQGDATWRTRPVPGQAADESLEGVVRALNYRASTTRRVEELAEVVARPCAEEATFNSRNAMPPTVRERVFGDYDASVEQSVTVTMDLPEAAAREWLGGCPGVHLAESSTEPDGSTFLHLESRPSFMELSRILGHEATRALMIHNLPLVR